MIASVPARVGGQSAGHVADGLNPTMECVLDVPNESADPGPGSAADDSPGESRECLQQDMSKYAQPGTAAITRAGEHDNRTARRPEVGDAQLLEPTEY
jgi:hypothetical protein